jgi:hypothetical protein
MKQEPAFQINGTCLAKAKEKPGYGIADLPAFAN